MEKPVLLFKGKKITPVPPKMLAWRKVVAFEDMDKATLNVARSKDGIEGWERYPHNPILSGGPEGSWDVEAVYKPWVMHMDGQWLLWANGRRAAVEQVGLYIHDGDNMFEDWND